MNGAESLINALAEHGVEAYFANPGTSEMQLVAALDQAFDVAIESTGPCLIEVLL